MSEVWERIRGRLFGPKGLFSSTPEDEAVMAECQKDIEQLEAQIKGEEDAVATFRSRIAELEAQLEPVTRGYIFEAWRQKVATMSALLDMVAHMQVIIDGKWECVPTCAACAWKAMKKGEPDETRP